MKIMNKQPYYHGFSGQILFTTAGNSISDEDIQEEIINAISKINGVVSNSVEVLGEWDEPEPGDDYKNPYYEDGYLGNLKKK